MKSLGISGALALVGLLAAGCGSGPNSAGHWIHAADQALTMYEPPRTSPYRAAKTSRCPEWRQLMRKEEPSEETWRFGCVHEASLVVSVHDKRDLYRGRTLRPSEGWEAKKVHDLYLDGRFDPGQGASTTGVTTR